MANEQLQDKPLDRDAIVGSYTSEMVTARTNLATQTTNLRRRVEAADVMRALPSGVRLTTYLDGTKTGLVFGALPADPHEALAARAAQRLLGQLDPSAPQEEVLIINYNDAPAEQGDNIDPLFHEDEPQLKVTWGSKQPDGGNAQQWVSIYDNGYVEHGSHTTRIDYSHPVGADELTQRYAQPTEKQLVDVEPLTTRPAETADVLEAARQVANMGDRYGLNGQPEQYS